MTMNMALNAPESETNSTMEVLDDVREKLPRQVKNAKKTIEIDDDLEDEADTQLKKQNKGPRVTKTGKILNQEKMLQRKITNCDNKGWITVNLEHGSYPQQAYVELKTGMYEFFRNNFIEFMKSFNIHLLNKAEPENSIKVTENENGIERTEYDLTMKAGDIAANLKVKMYHTKSSFDVQGLKRNYSMVFEELGNKTIAVYFVEVVLESIFQSMMIKCNLDEYNEYCKTQAKLGLNETAKQLNKNETSKKKEKGKKQAENESKCSICDLNSKELNSFKCHECSQLYHKNCVSKRTSPAEFSLLKKGDVTFDCEKCITNRRGITPLKSIDINNSILEIQNEVLAIVAEEPVISPGQKSIEMAKDIVNENMMIVNSHEDTSSPSQNHDEIDDDSGNNIEKSDDAVDVESTPIDETVETGEEPIASPLPTEQSVCDNCLKQDLEIVALIQNKETAEKEDALKIKATGS